MTRSRNIVYPDAGADLARLIVGERLARLETLGRFEVHQGRPVDAQDFVARIGDAHAVLLGWDIPVDAMRRAPNLEVISFTGTGAADFVDLEEATRLGITVTNTPGYAANTVAEHALALLLAVARSIPGHARSMRAGEWLQTPGFELRGRTLGLVGLGGIGARFAEMARALGMRVIAWTRTPDPARAARHGVEFMELDDVLATSDVVSLHLALTPGTAGLLGADRLDRMKPGAVLVNTARAGLVDEAALIARLADGRIAAAGLDVYDREPLPGDHPLRALDNVVLTPHVAYNTPEATEALFDMAIDNLVDYFAGNPANVVAGPAA